MRVVLLERVRAALVKAGLDASEIPAGLTVEAPKQAGHGDWATNAALVATKALRRPPRDLARDLIESIDDPEGYIDRMEVAGPGFINFVLSGKWWAHVLGEVVSHGDRYGRSDMGRGVRVQVEFVSANPTGPLHVGHGRGAAVGDVLARVLEAAGYEVEREYYINDAGRQMQTLGRSVYYRYLELWGRPVEYAPDLYQGDYIRELAAEVKDRDGERHLDRPEAEAVADLYPWAADRILDGIRRDLEAFGVRFDQWFSEKSLVARGRVEEAFGDLRERGHIYDQDGALWFAATRFGDDKDRVLVKSNGEKTYFASDIAYHRDKFGRGFDRVIDLWGADHHGYVPRLRSAVQALGYEPERLEVLLVQLVNLLRAGEPVAMSTRAGEFVTLEDVVAEVGADAARFFFLTRSSDSSLDFDLEVAKSQSSENPVYYVQYAHARIASVFKTAAERGLGRPTPDQADLSLLALDEELALIKQLAAFPDVVAGAAAKREPHRLTHFLIDLAKTFHPYYKDHRFVGEDEALSRARLVLAGAVKQVVANGLILLGISAPEKM